jgi:hypothetical protein
MPGVDNYAHIGGFASGFALGKLMADRQPAASPSAAAPSHWDGRQEWRRRELRLHAAQLLWAGAVG